MTATERRNLVMRKHKKLYDRMGMALLSLPSTKADRTNNKRRNVGNIDATSSAHVIRCDRNQTRGTNTVLWQI